MTDQPSGQRPTHAVLIRQIVGHAADHIAEHNADQRNHHDVFKPDALNKRNEDPCAQNGKRKGKERPPPQREPRQKQQGKQNPKLRRLDRRTRGRRNKFIPTKLLHNEPGHTHAHAGAQDRQQARQA